MLLGVGLAGEHALGQNGQPARRREGGDAAALGEQALAGEEIRDAAAEFLFGPGDHAGGDFFKTEFE